MAATASDHGASARQHYTVICHWDDEACVWYVAESDVPGLATEAATFEELESKLRVMVPELLALNTPASEREHVPFDLITRKRELAVCA